MNSKIPKPGALSTFVLSAGEVNALVDGCQFKDTSFYINGVSTIDAPFSNRIMFVEGANISDFPFDDRRFDNTLIVSDLDLSAFEGNYIKSKRPREIFSKIVCELFKYFQSYWQDFIDPLEAKTHFSRSMIMNNVNIHKTAIIGSGCIFYPGVVIGPNCKIGDNTIVKSNSVIGLPGFGIYKDEANKNQHFPHVGGVIIGSNVEIGALNTVCSGTIHPTFVDDYVKTDDHVHIAHNCVVREGVQIAAHAEISGSVVIGEDAWLSPNVAIRDGVELGENSFIGIGACVIKSFPKDCVVAGNPAKFLRNKEYDSP